MIKTMNSERLQHKIVLIFIGLLLLLVPLFLYLQHHYTLTRSLLIPAWSIPPSFQANRDDWVTIDLISPAASSEIPADTRKIVLRVHYSLQSKPTATLLIQLRSRLDLDTVDLGSNFSNLLATYDMAVENGTGEETVELVIEPRTLVRFPPGSQILPIASLQDSSYPSIDPTDSYFHRVFDDLALRVPEISQSCTFDAEHESLKVIQVISPPQFTESTPKAQVIVQYNLLASHAQIATLIGGFVNPTLDGNFTDLNDWKQQAGTWQHQDLEMPSGTIVLDLYSWFPTEHNQQIIDEKNQVVLALGLVCEWDSYYKTPEFSYSKVFPEHVFTFSSELFGLTPTEPPIPPTYTHD